VPQCVAVLLAAGGGTRFRGGSHKLLADLGGRPLWRHAFDAVCAAGFDHVVVVTGAVPLPLAPTPATIGGTTVHEVHHDLWSEGQATSLAAGIERATSLGAEAVVVGLADQPMITTDAWRAVASAPDDCRIVVAEYDGVPGPNPVRLAREVWPLLPRSGDEGARSLLRSHPEWVCRVACLGSADDVDTTEDLHRWRSSRTNSP
jgi:molybdenum cofactor cytidylyltransferase